jgi:hypothetical protein
MRGRKKGGGKEIPSTDRKAARPPSVRVVSRSSAETRDMVYDPSGGSFKMGPGIGWSPSDEGEIRKLESGTWVHAQSFETCTVCGGVGPKGPRTKLIGDDDTCAGCFRQGDKLARVVLEAAIATSEGDARRARNNPFWWTEAEHKPYGRDHEDQSS